MEGEGHAKVGDDIFETGPVAGAQSGVNGVKVNEKSDDIDLERERTLEGSEEKGSSEPTDEVEVGMTMEEAKNALKQLQKLTKPNHEQFQVTSSEDENNITSLACIVITSQY